MSTTVQDLARLRPGSHPYVHALFLKSQALSWNIDRDIDWSMAVDPLDACVEPTWAPFGYTPTFRALPDDIQRRVARFAVGRTLNILQVGESVAQTVCGKLVLAFEDDYDYRSHASAQAIEEARHHLALVRFLEIIGEEFEPINPITATAFDEILASDDPVFLVAGAQFFFENLGMPLLEKLGDKATHPLLKRIAALLSRDEARHLAFGLFYLTEFLRTAAWEKRLEFARYWLARIFHVFEDPYAPHVLSLTRVWLEQAGAREPEALCGRIWDDHRSLAVEHRPDALTHRRVHQLLSVGRRAGLLAPDILEALGLTRHPLILEALCLPIEAPAE